MKHKIGVMGSAVKDAEVTPKARKLGLEIADAGYVLITGGCGGLPYEVARGAKGNDGLTIGVSPALNFQEHTMQYKFPTEYYDVLIYTGTSLKGRNPITVYSCDAIITVGGRTGTLGEFVIAYDNGIPVGVLKGTGGASDKFIAKVSKLANKKNGQIIFESNPKMLVSRLGELLGGE